MPCTAPWSPGTRVTYKFLDDHSRAVVGYRWTHAQDTIRLQGALRAGVATRGVPKIVYVDNHTVLGAIG